MLSGVCFVLLAYLGDGLREPVAIDVGTGYRGSQKHQIPAVVGVAIGEVDKWVAAFSGLGRPDPVSELDEVPGLFSLFAHLRIRVVGRDGFERFDNGPVSAGSQPSCGKLADGSGSVAQASREKLEALFGRESADH